MQHQLKNLLFCSFLFTAVLYPQANKIKRVAKNFENYAYADAIEGYSSLVSDGQKDAETYKNLGDAHYLNADYIQAAEWYAKLFDLKDHHTEAEYLFKYAQALKSQERYAESDHWMRKFVEKKPEDSRAIRYKEEEDYLERIRKQSGRYVVKNLSFNSAESDFAPSFFGEDLVFSTARDSGIAARNLHVWNKRPFLNLYRARGAGDSKFKQISKLSKVLNTKAHESSTAFTKDGNTVYFTRNNTQGRAFARDSKGVSRLKIYKACFENGRWTHVVALPFNSDDYSVAHPALSPDERKLYFASDMPGTYGQSDIWVVDILADGSFGTPKNLGKSVNTEARETFPYITESNLLYFASDGHPGLGGLDVFASQLLTNPNSGVINIGRPVNSSEDDFSFILNEGSKEGFFASNRDGGKGQDDLYGFRETGPIVFDCDAVLAGIVRDDKTNEPISYANIALYDTQGNLTANGVSLANGHFLLTRDCSTGSFLLKGAKDGYSEGNLELQLSVNGDDRSYELRLIREEKSVNLSSLTIEPIYFDFDKANIRLDAEVSIQKVLEYLKKYPLLKVQIGSHTDSRASHTYNEKLSQRRAEATKEYLITQGIHPNRISAIGFGEGRLTNECDDTVKCLESKHQKNRRSEFILVE